MKTILRNLLSVLCRFKMATLLNVLGLSVAFSAFILIMMQVDYGSPDKPGGLSIQLCKSEKKEFYIRYSS